MKHVTRALMAGVMRGSLHFREVQESHKASGGIYKGGGKAKAESRKRGVKVDVDAVYVPTLLKAANLEKGQTHANKNTQKYAHKCDCRLMCLNKRACTKYACKDATMPCIHNSDTHIYEQTQQQ